MYCYRVIPFRLKNAGATYHRLVNNMFKKQIGINMEVYINDMLVKILRVKQQLADLEETFDTFRRYLMKLNLDKCAFGVVVGKFLRFMIS